MAGAVCFLGDGRAVPAGSGRVRGTESGAGAAGGKRCLWPWSNPRAHLSARDDGLGKVAPLLAMVGDWQGLLDSALSGKELTEFRGHGRTGRPLGHKTRIERMQARVGRVLKPQKGGRPKKQTNQ